MQERRNGQRRGEATQRRLGSGSSPAFICAQVVGDSEISGEMRILTMGLEDSDDDFVAPASPASYPDMIPDTSQLDQSEFSLQTKMASGVGQGRVPLPFRLRERECGRGRTCHPFAQSERCSIGNAYLPNRVEIVASYNNKAFCGTHSKDGNTFLSASQDRCLRLYDTTNGQFKLERTVAARDVGWSILDTAFSPDGTCLVYSSWSECIHLCRMSLEGEAHEALSLSPDDRRFCIFSLVFSHDGQEILGGANDGFLYVYDRASQRRCLRIDAHEDDVNAVAFADATSQILFSGGDDGFLKVWDRRTLSEANPVAVGTLAGHMDGLTYVEPRGDGRFLLSNSKDQTIKLWDMRKFSGEGAKTNTRKAVASHNWDYRWQKVPKKLMYPKTPVDGDTSVMTYRGHKVLQTLIRCHFSPIHTTGQRYIYTGCASGRVVVYDALTGRVQAQLHGHRSCVRDVSWHPFNNEIISTSWDGMLGKWTYAGKDESHEITPVEEVRSKRRGCGGGGSTRSSGRGVHYLTGGTQLRRSARLAQLRSTRSPFSQ